MTKVPSRILVIDDDPDIRETLIGQLTSEGYKVHALCDGYALLDSCVEYNIEVVVTDLDMPRVNGMTVLSELQKRLPQVLIIAMSGHCHGEANFLEMAKFLGAHRVLGKPFRPTHLGRVIRESWSSRTRNDPATGVCET